MLDGLPYVRAPPPSLPRPLRHPRAPSVIPPPTPSFPHPVRHSRARSATPAPSPSSLHHLPSFLRRQESMRAASIREQRRCSTASRTSEHPLRHSRTSSVIPAPPPSLPRPLHHSRTRSVIPPPPCHSRAPSAIPVPLPVIPAQAGIHASCVDSRTAPMLNGLPYVRAPPADGLVARRRDGGAAGPGWSLGFLPTQE